MPHVRDGSPPCHQLRGRHWGIRRELRAPDRTNAPGRPVVAKGYRADRRTVTLVRKVRGTQRLSLSSGSVDLVTSSMVVSQFEHEPYQFSSRCWRRSFLLGRVRSERSSPMMITHSGCCAYTRMRWSREVERSLSSGRGARPGSGLSGTRTDAATNLRPHAKRRRPPVTLPPTPNFRSMPRCAGLSRYPCVTQIVTESLPPKTG